MLLNGRVQRDSETPVHLERDRIDIDGIEVRSGPKIYLMLNKPRGLLTTASDDKGRDTVYSVLKSEDGLPWLAPVGRLDKASEGLLLLTNDSEWGARVAAPESHLQKTYHVQIGRVADESVTQAITRGIRTEDADLLRARECRLLRSGEKNSWLEIVLDEGKNRQIRRMLEMLEIDVLRLIRVALGPLQLGKLAKGAYRHLSPQEKQALDRAMKPQSHA